MNQFSKYPFVFLVIFLALGISLGIYVSIFAWFSIPLFFWFYFTPIKKLHLYLSLAMVFCVGVFLSKGLLRNQEVESRKIVGEKALCQVEVEEVNDWGDQARILASVQRSTDSYLEDKKVYLTVSENRKYQIGEVLLFESKLSPFRKPSIPEQFDFEKYYRNRGILAQCFLDAEAIVRLEHHKNWRFWIQEFRNYLEGNLDELLLDNDERAIIKALVVGNRSDLDSDLKSKYVAAGIFHVLAVSGLHVGVIYFVIMFFVKRLRSKIFQVVLLLVSLAFYACLTGLSQSVIRAGVMFAFFGLAYILNRKTSSINVLFGSVFVILIFQPVFLYESGFQLSISAVLGILLFFRWVESWVNSKYAWLNKIWSLAAVSIAAQSLTTPLILYYFHQFPTYFIFINVIVVFLVQFVLVFGSIAALLGSSFGVGTAFAQVAEFLCKLINQASIFTSDLPMSRINGIFFGEWQVVLLLAAILAFYFFYSTRKRLFFYLSFLLFIATSLFINKRFLNYKGQDYWALHKVKNHLVIEKVIGRSSILYYDSSFLASEDLEIAMGNYWAKRNISTFEFEKLEFPFIWEDKIIIESYKELHDPKVLVLSQSKWKFEILCQSSTFYSSENGMTRFFPENEAYR